MPHERAELALLAAAFFPAYPLDLGGTDIDDRAAHTTAWPHVIEHLHQRP